MSDTKSKSCKEDCSAVSLDDIVSLCKRRGFVYPAADSSRTRKCFAGKLF